MSQGVISLNYKNQTLLWKYPKGDIVEKIKNSLQTASKYKQQFFESFVDEMDRNFKQLKKPKGQTLLQLSIHKIGEEWNVELSKFGFILQTYRSSDFSNILRKSPLNISDF